MPRCVLLQLADKRFEEAPLKRLGARLYFSDIFTAASVGYGKDEPDIYRTAQKYPGIWTNETMAFEDVLYAIQTAKAEGFVTAAVLIA